MDLIDVLHQIGQENQKAMRPTDLCFGTVASVDPLSVTLETTMQAIPEAALVLTDAVREKFAEVEIEGETYVIPIIEPLQPGELVVMLRCAAGQRFVILSRAK